MSRKVGSVEDKAFIEHKIVVNVDGQAYPSCVLRVDCEMLCAAHPTRCASCQAFQSILRCCVSRSSQTDV